MTAAPKTQRDEWMMVPPKQDDLAARMDPTKIRARGFNAGKKSAAAGEGTAWNETPEEKRLRLEREVLGIAPTKSEEAEKKVDERKEDEEKARRVREYNEKYRGKSLMDMKKGGEVVEDDPSKRTFDYEKDMGAGTKIGHKQRKELLEKAKGFQSKFGKGSFL